MAPTNPKPKVYEVLVECWRYNKDGSTRKTYSHLIKYPGWDDFFAPSKESLPE